MSAPDSRDAAEVPGVTETPGAGAAAAAARAAVADLLGCVPEASLSFCLLDDSAEKVLVVPLTGADSETGQLRRILSLAGSALSAVVRDGEVLLLTSAEAEGDAGLTELLEPCSDHLLLVPVVQFDRIIGALSLGRNGASFSEADRAATRSAAAGLAPLLAGLSLHHRQALSETAARRAYEQLTAFSRAGNLIVQEKDLDRICNLFMQALREHAVFRRGILTLLDDDLRGYKWFFFGMTDEEIEYFHAHSTHKMTREQRARVFQEKYRVGHSYYIPSTSHWDYSGVRSRRAREDMLDWHPDDFLFIPLYGSSKRMVGIVSVDDPSDGRAPTAEGLSSLELFANQVAHAIEEKKLDSEVKKSTSRYRTLVETMNDGLVVLDFAERITLANPTLCKLVGYRVEEVIGSSLYAFLSEASRAVVLAKRDERRLGIKSRYEVELVSKDGAPIPALLSGAPLVEAHRLVGSFAVISDLREAKKAEEDFRKMHGEIVVSHERLQESMQRLKTTQEQLVQAEKLSAIGELVSGVAHELNNPLTGVLGYAQLLLGREAPERVRADLAKIHREAMRCQKIVQNLLTFARKHKPEKHFVDINAIVESTLELRAYQLRVDNITVERRLDPGLPRTMADEHQIQQVLINILNNAHQAMMEAGGGGRLEIATRVEAGMLVITFQDSGPGIPEDKLGRIFDPFFTTKEIGKGTGLGLSLSYGIIHEHGGTIGARNAPGGGALFRIELPVREEERQPGATPPAAPAAPPRSRRVLVVDDEPTVLELLSDLLSSRGHRVVTAADGRQALECLRRAPGGFDLIVSDIRMPVLDGPGLHAAVLEMAPDLARRMIFATGDTAGEEARAFLAASGCAFLAKPFQLEDMEALMARLCDEGEGAPAARRE